MQSFSPIFLGNRLVQWLVIIVLMASAVFSFVPQVQASASPSDLLSSPKPRVANILPVETDSYSISITGTEDVFLSIGDEVFELNTEDSSLPEDLVGGGYFPYEDGGYSITLPVGNNYDIAFVTGTEPVNLSVYRMDEIGTTVEVVKYCNCDFGANIGAQIQISSSKGISDLYYDSDRDGELDTKVVPNVRDVNPNGVDLLNPEVYAEEKYIKGKLKLALVANDNEQVDSIYYYFGDPIVNLDGTLIEKDPVDKINSDQDQSEQLIKYKKPIEVTAENNGKTVFVTAFDKVGNQSTWIQYTIGSILPSKQGTAVPKWAENGQLVKFAADPLYYLVSTEDSWSNTNGLIPLETNRMRNFFENSLSADERLKMTFSDEDSSLYTRYVDLTVEKLVAEIIFYCTDYPFPNGSLVLDDGVVYLVIGCTKTPFVSMEALTGLGYSANKIISADLDQYHIKLLPAVTSKVSAHPWGSWVSHNGTIYYAHPEGMIPVPSMEIFADNKGSLDLVLPATAGDIEEIALATDAMTLKDYRVSLVSTFGIDPYQADNITPIAERRDQKRYGDISEINWAINIYRNSNDKVPDSLSQLVPEYISAIPQAPIPADGTCTTEQNSYQYERISDSEYKIHYCLGTKLYGSYGPGPEYSSGYIYE